MLFPPQRMDVCIHICIQRLICPSVILRTSKPNTVTPELSQVAATATAEISTPTTETHITTVVSSEIPVETKKANEISVAANHDVPTATDTDDQISMEANNKVAEISVATKEAKEINMAAENIVSEIFMETTDTSRKTVVSNEAAMAAVELIEGLCSAYMER